MGYDAINILASDEGKAKLAVEFRGVLENIQAKTLAMQLRSTDLSGDPKGGRIEVKKFKNFESAEYGTAASGRGDTALKEKIAYIDIDKDREIIKDIEEKDAKLYGVDDLVGKVGTNAEKTMTRELDKAFFTYAESVATAYTPGEGETTILDILDGAVTELNELSNDYIDGVDDEDIVIVLNSANYKKVRRYLDSVANSNVNSTEGTFRTLHDIQIEKAVRLPDGCGGLIMIKNIIGLPVLVNGVNTEKVQKRNAVSAQLFYDYGVGTATPEGILKISDGSSSVTP
jgi:hypothetical protein